MCSVQETPNFINDTFSYFIKHKTKKMHFGRRAQNASFFMFNEICKNDIDKIGCLLQRIYVKITLNNGQQYDNNKEEETDIKENSINFIIVTIRRLNNITNTTAGSDTLVQVENETLKIKV